MGGHPYWYFVPYEADVSGALSKLREREFKAGRYSPVIRIIEFREPAFSGQQPGPWHASIEAVMEAVTEEGTRSILDISSIGQEPDYGVAAPVDGATLRELYGTDKPTRRMLEGLEFIDDVDRGHCIYIVVYENDEPREICFAGYSYD